MFGADQIVTDARFGGGRYIRGGDSSECCAPCKIGVRSEGQHMQTQGKVQFFPVECEATIDTSHCKKHCFTTIKIHNRNLVIVQLTYSECIEVLAALCKMLSLASLKLCFPKPIFWQETQLQETPSDYVGFFLGK